MAKKSLSKNASVVSLLDQKILLFIAVISILGGTAYSSRLYMESKTLEAFVSEPVGLTVKAKTQSENRSLSCRVLRQKLCAARNTASLCDHVNVVCGDQASE